MAFIKRTGRNGSDQVAYFNYLVDDIDRRQAVGGLMDALSAESSEGTANAMDEDIAALAGTADAPKLFKSTTAITVDNILKQIVNPQLADNTHAWELLSDGSYKKIKREAGVAAMDSQSHIKRVLNLLKR